MTARDAIAGPLAHGWAGRPAPGESHSGDRAVVVRAGAGALVAAIDGLGHGRHAAAAADAAAEVLAAHAGAHPASLLRRCHEALRRTRGAAVSVATVTAAGDLEWMAVGNVQGVVARASGGATTRLVTRGGVVGLRLPPMRAAAVALAPGDLLMLYTDGVADAAVRDLALADNLQTVAERLLDRHARGTDDALVVVAAYQGGRP